MYNPVPSKFSTDKKLEIKFLDCEEINNGRMLWKVSVLYKNTNFDEFVFPKGWNYLNFELDNWILEDEKNRFYYLPIEGVSSLMNTETLKIHQLPNQMLSTIRFTGNYFEANFLIEKYDDMTVKTDLETLISEKIKTKK